MNNVKTNYDQIVSDYEKTKLLYDDGVVSKSQFESIKLKLDISKEEYKSVQSNVLQISKANYDMALTDYKDLIKKIDNGQLICDLNGYVKKVHVKEGNQIISGEDIITISSDSTNVTVGLSADEKINLSIGDEALILDNERSINGKIVSISDNLDPTSLLYQSVIAISEDALSPYSIVNAKLAIGSFDGARVPIQSLFNDGKPYVFIVEDNEAVKKEVEVVGYEKEFVIIRGVQDQDEIIILGNKVLRGGEKVTIND